MKKTILTIVILVTILLTACATANISDLKNEKYIGKSVTISGTASKSIKLGKLSGFTLTDKNEDSIPVSSQTLPADNSKVTVRGTIIKDTLLGYYIKADTVR